MDQAVAYNTRADLKNVQNTLPTSSYDPVGYRLRGDAIALALQCESWERPMTKAVGYQIFGDQLKFFWHRQFRLLFPDHARPLRTMNWSVMTETMAMAIVLGLEDEGIYQGYLTYASLRQMYQLQEAYELQHRRAHAFMLRLFSAWQGNVDHVWPAYAYDEPVYEGILERWRDPSPAELAPWLLAACDRHTHQAQPDTEKAFFDFSSLTLVPLEILFLFRLRQLLGLSNPVLDHPLMETPFDQLPEVQSPYKPDELMLGTLARVREDWPEFDSAVSFGAVKNAALGRE
jgi:hypothetical protein